MSARAVGVRLVMVPLTVAALDERAAEDDLDAGAPELRGRVASTLAALGQGTAWPPEPQRRLLVRFGGQVQARAARCAPGRLRARRPERPPAADVTDG